MRPQGEVTAWYLRLPGGRAGGRHEAYVTTLHPKYTQLPIDELYQEGKCVFSDRLPVPTVVAVVVSLLVVRRVADWPEGAVNEANTPALRRYRDTKLLPNSCAIGGP